MADDSIGLVSQVKVAPETFAEISSFKMPIRSIFVVFVLALTASATAATPAASVGVAPVLQEEVANEVTLIGSAIPRRTTRVSAQVDGMVTAMSVDRGSHVEAGDPLFQLDAAIAQFDLDRAKALLAQAHAEVAEAERKYKEAERLRAEGHVPQTTLDTAGTTAAIARARRAERRAEVGRAERLFDQHLVKAPFSGTVVTKSAEVGQWIRSDSAVLQIVETDPARIEVPVPEHLYTQLENDATAVVRFESLPNQQFVAELGALVPQGLEGARTFPVWLEIDNEDRRIAPGMSARVTLSIGQEISSALFVPSDALVRRADGSTLVWLVEEDESVDDMIARAVRVRVGDANGDRSQVEGDGISVGDLVVVRGNESLRPNQRVRIVTGPIGGR